MVAELFKTDNADAVDAEANILQALALMNSAGIDQSTAPAKRQHTGRRARESFFRHGRTDRNPVPLDPQPPPHAQELAKLVKYVDSAGTHSRLEAEDGERLSADDHDRPDEIARRQGRRVGRRLLGAPQQQRILDEPLKEGAGRGKDGTLRAPIC